MLTWMQKQIAVKKLEKLIYTEIEERNKEKYMSYKWKIILSIYLKKKRENNVSFHNQILQNISEFSPYVVFKKELNLSFARVNMNFFKYIIKKKRKEQTMVAKVTEIKTRDALLRFISSAVPRAVGTTTKGKKTHKE
jgi:Holliday junction resolvase